MKCKYWYEDHFVVGINNYILHQVLRCNYSGNGLHIGMTPVYSEWLK